MLYKRPFFIIRFLFMKHIMTLTLGNVVTITAFSERF